ncbi:MAG TPA: Fe-S-containing protein [Nitrospirota bacterium]|jgi:uncharacterized membrane protein|nr:Fe-S-containing protein [Nitrospirota bacterium]
MAIKDLSQQGTMKAVHHAVKCGLSFLVAASFLITSLSACSKQPSYPAPQRIGADIVIETSDLELEVPKFYTYRYQGKDINFFLLKMSDRTLSFLDACRSCYTHKMGYRCDGNEVICRYCKMRFPIGKLEKGIGNCYPIRIEGRIDGGKYLISVATLESSADKF